VSLDRFSLKGRVAIITGGAGLLGIEHAMAIVEAGGQPVLWDIDTERATAAATRIAEEWKTSCHGVGVDITDESAIDRALAQTLEATGRVDILINNAANNPMVNSDSDILSGRIEKFSLQAWNDDIAVGLTGAFLCSRMVGAHLARAKSGVILNIASDLGLIAPDQRVYRKDGVEPEHQSVKPVTYSVVKHGLIGLTRYLATYWADAGVRVNALAPGGVRTDQSQDFVAKLVNLIPMERMARRDEYRGAVQFLCSDASSYMTGAVISIDGGRTAW
jgi:NAD(P)-dependent dehydrogenase (short-subunit alcohol dehydrogenase family)